MVGTGFRGKKGWKDLSDYLVHFTGGQGRDGLEILESILTDRELRRGPDAFGAMHWCDKLKQSQRSVCLSEIPLGFQKRMVQRRGKHAIAFSRRLLIDAGAAPVWYLERGSVQSEALRQVIQEARDPRIDVGDALWKLTPYIDTSGEFPETDTIRRFEWEREWRLCRDFQFEFADVEFLALPSEEHDRARGRYAKVGYQGPFVDPAWSIGELEEKLDTQRIAS